MSYSYDSVNNFKFIKRNNCLVDIFNSAGKHLLIPAPKGFCNKKIVNNVNYLWINFNKESEKKIEFYFFLKQLKYDLEKFLSNGENIQNFFYENGFGASIQNFKGNNIVELYYNKDTRMDILDCPERFYIRPLFWFQNIRQVENKWYINYCMIQAIIYPIYLKLGKCLIEDTHQIIEPAYQSQITTHVPDDDAMITYAKHPIYGKYFKMISIGIPRAAVQIKITNEIGKDGIQILQHHPDDIIVLRKIKQSEHSNYMRFFKMLTVGIPRKAVEQKMFMENIDINILNEPDKLIIDLPTIINSDFSQLLISKKLKNISKNEKTTIKPSRAINPQINMADILKKRDEILNKMKSSFI